MKKFLIITVLALSLACEAFAWGQKGHDVVAYVAECNLTPRAAKNVTRVLEGHSPVYYANWLDNASHTKEYAYTSTWHYANVDEGYTFETMPRLESGDVVKAINDIVAQLKSEALSAAEENIALRMLIHLVGDLHCPMHAGRKSDRGGNGVKVLYFGRNTNLHSVWDSSLVESAHNWSYTEWQKQIDILSKSDKAAVQQGSVEEWFKQTHSIAERIYAATPEGKRFSYDEVAEYAPVIEQQLMRGGLRLAALLNEIYG